MMNVAGGGHKKSPFRHLPIRQELSFRMMASHQTIPAGVISS